MQIHLDEMNIFKSFDGTSFQIHVTALKLCFLKSKVVSAHSRLTTDKLSKRMHGQKTVFPPTLSGIPNPKNLIHIRHNTTLTWHCQEPSVASVGISSSLKVYKYSLSLLFE